MTIPAVCLTRPLKILSEELFSPIGFASVFAGPPSSHPLCRQSLARSGTWNWFTREGWALLESILFPATEVNPSVALCQKVLKKDRNEH